MRIGPEVIDGNVDSLVENPTMPPTVTIPPYWGPLTDIPADRRLQEDQGKKLPQDHDVSDIWWPELRAWLEKKCGGTVEPSAAGDAGNLGDTL